MTMSEQLDALSDRVSSVQVRVEQVHGLVQGVERKIEAAAAAASEERRALHAEQMRKFQDVMSALDMRARLEALEARMKAAGL